jgi:hypothetical protein
MYNSNQIETNQIRGTVDRDSRKLAQHPQKLAPTSLSTEKVPAGLLRKQASQDSFHIFSKLPPSNLWLKSGMVERQTSATDFVWQPRMMILSAEDIIFAKPETDAIVDRLPLRTISFVGKVDRRQDGTLEHAKWGSFTKKKKRRKNSTTALFSPAARPTLAEEGKGGTTTRQGGFALEIRTASEDRERSYFFRTDTVEAREMWLTHILDAVRAASAANSEESNAVTRFQVGLLSLRGSKLSMLTSWRASSFAQRRSSTAGPASASSPQPSSSTSSPRCRPARACSAAVRRELERIEARGGLGRVLGGASR